MSGGSKKKSGSKKGVKGDASNNGNDSSNETTNPLVRSLDNRSINPRSILTGFYQKNGKRVQMTVQDGALQMPKDSLDVIEKATAKYCKVVPPNKRSDYELPGLDSVVRPCLDPKLETMVVTELVMEKVQIAQEQPAPPAPAPASGTPTPVVAVQPPIIKMVKTLRPSAKNKRIRRFPTKQAGAERIRGGGGEQGQPPKQESAVAPPTAAAATATVPAVPSAPASAGPVTASSSQPTTGTNDLSMAPAVPPPSTTAMDATATPAATPSAQTTNAVSIPSDTGGAQAVQPPAAVGNTAVPSHSKAEPAPTTTDSQSAPISAIPVSGGSSVPMPAIAPQEPAVGSKSVPADAPSPSSNPAVTTQQQPAPAPAPAAKTSTPAAPTTALSSGNAATVTKSAAVAIGNDEGASSSNQSQSTPLAQVQAAPSVQVAKPTETVAKPTSSVAPVAAVITAPATTKPTAEASKDSSAVKSESTAPPSSGAATAASKPAEVASSSSAVKPVQAQVKEEKKKPAEKVPEAKALEAKPAPQWEQHKPGPNDETITPENQLPPKPEWYKRDGINELERTMLPEWFDSSSPHRSPESYVKTRNKIIEMSEALSNRNVTNAMIRRSILGDAGSLQRLRSFLVNWGIINRDGINDSAPTTASLRPDLKRAAKFTNDMRDTLILAVTEQASKKRKLMVTPSSPTPSLSLDWEEIASKVGYGVTAENCRENFMTAPLKEEASTAMDVTDDSSPSSVPPEGTGSSHSQEKLIQTLVANSNPEVVKKVFDVAMEASDFNSVETRAASLLGLHLTQAVENARGHEIDLALRLSKLLDARMQKLENRMAMMDDVEGILEAEKVALEMERRDLYTARCRHWFGGV